MTRAPFPWHDSKNTGKTKHEQHVNARYERRRNEIAMRENGPSTAAEPVQVKGLENRLTEVEKLMSIWIALAQNHRNRVSMEQVGNRKG